MLGFLLFSKYGAGSLESSEDDELVVFGILCDTELMIYIFYAF